MVDSLTTAAPGAIGTDVLSTAGHHDLQGRSFGGASRRLPCGEVFAQLQRPSLQPADRPALANCTWTSCARLPSPWTAARNLPPWYRLLSLRPRGNDRLAPRSHWRSPGKAFHRKIRHIKKTCAVINCGMERRHHL